MKTLDLYKKGSFFCRLSIFMTTDYSNNKGALNEPSIH